ncbi:zinc ABC transporter substrate-binding protein, partial [Beggiatoa alba]|nr:zinc ABC transporter substrate-binding protein [Beggiatoa alba]
MSMLIRAFLIAVLLSTNLASIPARAGITESDNRLSVVTTFSILADMAHVIGGEHVAVYTLVNPEADVHVYQPRPRDAQRLAEADVLIING